MPELQKKFLEFRWKNLGESTKEKFLVVLHVVLIKK